MAKKEAPGELELVSAFVNTIEVDVGEDELAGPEALARWLCEHGLLGRDEQAAPGDVARAVELREALRALLLANNGGPADPHAAEVLDAAARRARLGLRFDADGRARLAPERGGVDGALGRLLAVVARAMEAGTWPRLKACRSDACLWAFYDHTKNRSGVWCTMEVCGNRTKVRAYRARRSSAR
jgi:predicted RNA-binding Zn ribbon-like protein